MRIAQVFGVVVTATLFLGGCATQPAKTETKPAPLSKNNVSVNDDFYLSPSFSVDKSKTKVASSAQVQKTVPVWVVKKGATVKSTVMGWAKQSNWDVSWEVKSTKTQLFNTKDVPIPAKNLPEAVSILFKSLNMAKKGIYQVPYAGNKIVRIYERN